MVYKKVYAQRAHENLFLIFGVSNHHTVFKRLVVCENFVLRCKGETSHQWGRKSITSMPHRFTCLYTYVERKFRMAENVM